MTEYKDLVICGGGLAGLCLARQLSLCKLPLSILVLDQLPRPLPEAAFKVGESTIEAGAYYYRDTLQLAEHLETEHLEKLGLRYFFQSPDGDRALARRPEYGVSHFLPAKSHQIDRGKFENHLRKVVAEARIDLREGVQVQEVTLNGEGNHQVSFLQDDKVQSVDCRWVVDAMGRRRYLQTKLDLRRPSPGTFNSAWFRLQGKLRVQDLVPDAEAGFHGRVAEDRWNSTNHLMGPGYWVWVIPLAPDVTSVGIVADDALHPFAGYSTFERSMAWLEEKEPLLAKEVAGYPLLDFKRLKNYSYTSKQIFSAARWACIGEAATFADPYYSVGSNLIAYANGFVQRFLELDRESQLTEEYVAYANRFVINLNDALTDTIHRGYPYLYNGPVLTLKTIWDYYTGWGTADPQLYHEAYLDPKRAGALSGLLSGHAVAHARMMEMFERWGAQTSHYRFEFVDYMADLPTLIDLHKRTLPPINSDFGWLLRFVREAASRIEELAQVIFFLAVEDVLPREAARFAQKPWINIEAISLEPERWEADGLFRPTTRPRDIGLLDGEIRGLFRRETEGAQVYPCRMAQSRSGSAVSG